MNLNSIVFRSAVRLSVFVFVVVVCIVGTNRGSQAAELLVADMGGNQILAFDPQTGAYKRTLVSSGLDAPTDLAFGPGGVLLVADRGSGNVLKFDPVSGAALGVFAGGISEPVGLLYNDVSSEVFVADLDNFMGTTIYRFDSAGNPLPSIVTNPVGHYGMAYGPNGNLFATDVASFLIDGTSTGYVGQYDTANDYAPLGTYAADPMLMGAAGITFDAQGNLYAASLFGQSVIAFDDTGASLGPVAFVPYPNDLLFAGPGQLWVTSLGNNNPDDPIYDELFPGMVFQVDLTTGVATPFAMFGDGFLPTALLLSPVPEPSGLVLLALGAGMIMRVVRRRKNRS